MIYFDNASTTQLDPSIYSDIESCMKIHYGNASSIHTLGQKARHIIEESRETIATILKVQPSEIIFTSSGTESINTALKGLFFALKKENPNVHFITSMLEHSATLETIEWLSKSYRAPVDYIQHDTLGRLDFDSLPKQYSPSTAYIISILHINNELGNINDIAFLANLAYDNNLYLHVDEVQACGKLPLNLQNQKISLASLSGHKFHGPKGVGVLFCRKDIPIEPLFHGGYHELGKRSGTENTAGAIGIAKALQLACLSYNESYTYISKISEIFLESLTREGVAYKVNGDLSNKLPHILNITFLDLEEKKIASDVLLQALSLKDIAASRGSACSSGLDSPSRILLELNISVREAKSSVRFSFSKFNSINEAQVAAKKIASILSRFS